MWVQWSQPSSQVLSISRFFSVSCHYKWNIFRVFFLECWSNKKSNLNSIKLQSVNNKVVQVAEKCPKNECEDSSGGFWKLWWPYLTFFWHFVDWMINRWTDDINVGLIGDKRDWLSEAAVALRFPVGWKVLPSLKRKKAWSVWMQVMCSASVLSAMHISSLALSKSYGGWVNK